MRYFNRAVLFCLILIVSIQLGGSPQEGALSLRGRIIGAGMGLDSAAVRIDLNGPSTAEEMQTFNRHWDLEDRDGFMAAFLDTRRGTLRFVGGAGSSIPVHAAKISSLDSGRRILLVSEFRGSIFSGTRKKAMWTGRFLAVVLDIDASGKGEGTIHEDAVIDFRRDDIVLISYASTPKKIINVQPAK